MWRLDRCNVGELIAGNPPLPTPCGLRLDDSGQRILGIVALGAALAGCASSSADRLAEQRANEATCKSSIAHGNTESMAECVAGVKRDLEYVRTHPAPGPVDTAYVPAPVYNAISGRRAASEYSAGTTGALPVHGWGNGHRPDRLPVRRRENRGCLGSFSRLCPRKAKFFHFWEGADGSH